MLKLLTRSYLRSRYLTATAAIVFCLIGAILIGLFGLQISRSHVRYSKALIAVIKAENRFEQELAWAITGSLTGERDSQLRSELKDTYRNLVAIYTAIRSTTEQADGASTIPRSDLDRPWNQLAASIGADLAAEKSALNLAGGMPAVFCDLWSGDKQTHEGLQSLIGEVIARGYPLVQADGPYNALHREQARAIEALSTTKLRPALQEAERTLAEFFRSKAAFAFNVLFACCLAGIALALASAAVIFLPMERAILTSQGLLVRERDRALALERAKRDFSAMISHELRTPLNGILGFSTLLQSTELTPVQKEYVETIYGSAGMLLGLLNDILDLLIMEKYSLELDIEDFAISDAATNVVALLTPRAVEKGLELGVYIDPSLPVRMRGDARRLRQILLNLAGNAIKFTTKGSVVIEVKLKTTCENGSYDVLLSVADTGIGITKEHLDKIFDRFTQVDTSASRKYEGTGLGLPICRELVGLMGGEIGVESIPGQGSTFWMRVKLADAILASPTIAEDLKVSIKGKRILVVDGDPLISRVLSLQLKGVGAEIKCVASASAALAALSQAPGDPPYDLAIINQKLPDTAGSALIRPLRTNPRYKPLKLMLYADGTASNQQAQAAAFDAACSKPVTPEKLLLMVHRLLSEETSRPVENKPQKATPVLKQREPGDAGRRILVAEDNPTNKRLIAAMLERAGYSIDIVADGVEAVEAAGRVPYDLIIMDIRMPSMNGIEATRHIRSMSGPVSRCPILALTANAMVGDREEYMAAGMTDYISKPIDFEVLIGKIEHYLSKKDGGAFTQKAG
jgi:signal transduction histidine kinase/CheY-like chemotaxis protein